MCQILHNMCCPWADSAHVLKFNTLCVSALTLFMKSLDGGRFRLLIHISVVQDFEIRRETTIPQLVWKTNNKNDWRTWKSFSDVFLRRSWCLTLPRVPWHRRFSLCCLMSSRSSGFRHSFSSLDTKTTRKLMWWSDIVIAEPSFLKHCFIPFAKHLFLTRDSESGFMKACFHHRLTQQ